MRPGACFAGSAAALLAIVACTSQDRPAEDGDCVPVDGGICSSPVLGGGSSSGGGDGSAGSCPVSDGESACELCASSSCCSDLQACSNQTACLNLESCEADCNGVGSCVTSCQQQFPSGVSTLQVFTTCALNKCPVCSESGVGDPCGSLYPPCVAGLGCNGSWCTKACAHSSDCAGLDAEGTSSLGVANVCMATTAGYLCAPGCGAGGNCSDFASTYCLSTSDADAVPVVVCTFLPEASTAD